MVTATVGISHTRFRRLCEPASILFLSAISLCTSYSSAVNVEEKPATEAFLAAENPLRVLSILPGPTSGDDTDHTLLNPYARTALTVVFSRAVIALGSDWSDAGNDGNLPTKLLPFTLVECPGQPAFAVEGKIRWSTTSIARFDVEYDWPSDLCFNLVINPLLETFDGLSMSADDGITSRTFKTREVSMSVRDVISPQASNLTGGIWTSRVPGTSKHECPPDSVLYLNFNSALDHATAFATLKKANAALLADDSWHNCGATCLAVKPRGLQPGTDYKFLFPKGGVYSLVAGKAGSDKIIDLTGLQPFRFTFKMNQYSGQRYRRFDLYLRHGLAAGVDTQTQLAALKAAIRLKDSRGSSLSHSVSLVDKATLRLECEALTPNQKDNSIEVLSSSDVSDGYGQQLQASRAVDFKMADWPNTFLVASGEHTSFREFRSGWTVLAGGDDNKQYGTRTPYEVRAWPVTSANFASALAQANNRQGSLLREGKQTLTAPLRNPLEKLTIESSSLGGLFLHEKQTSTSYKSSGFVSVTEFGLTVVATPSNELVVWASNFTTGKAVDGAVIKVYRLPTYNAEFKDVVIVAEGVTNAEGLVTLTPKAGEDWHEEGVSRYSQKFVCLAEAGGQLAVSFSVPRPWQDTKEASTRGVLITDRQIYQTGDPVFVKGYLRSLNAAGDSYELPTMDTKSSVYVEVSWKRSSRSTRRIPASFVADFGTVSAELVVPSDEDDVTYGEVQLRLLSTTTQVESSKGEESKGTPPKVLGTTTITVADPRPPTVSLKLSTSDDIVLPGQAASMSVSMHASTYTGLAVEGVNVTLTWKLKKSSPWSFKADADAHAVHGIRTLPSIKPAPSSEMSIGIWPPDGMPGENHQYTGQQTVTIGKDGLADVTLDLAQLVQAQMGADGVVAAEIEEGDSFSVTARWVGPTREVVTAELEGSSVEGGALKVARSSYTLSVKPARAVDTVIGLPLPGTPLPVYVDVRDKKGNRVSNVNVSVSLVEWNGETPVREEPVMIQGDAAQIRTAVLRPGLLPVTSWGAQVGSTCTISASGLGEAQCASELTLPEGKKYVVLAQATDPEGTELVSAFAVGKTPAEWEASPLASLDTVVRVQQDKSTYAVGDTAALTFLSPFTDANAFVVWGNGAGRSSKIQSLAGPAGKQHTIALRLGNECRFGCNVWVCLVAPSQSKDAVMPVKVPVSPLLDLTLPSTASTSVKLEVPDDNRAFAPGSIQVAITSQEDSASAVEVVKPGSNAFVRVVAPAGAEAAIFVVDKAMLDIGGAAKPHDVVELDKSFEIRQYDRIDTGNTYDTLASDAGYSHTVSTMLRRSKLDPWAVETQWRLRPSSYYKTHAEETDEEYFAGLTSQITDFPTPNFYYDAYYGSGGGYYPAPSPGMPEMSPGMPGMAASESAQPRDGKAMVADSAEDDGNVAAMGGAPEPSGGGGSSQSGDSGGSAAYIRSEFLSTPLFNASTVIDSSGVAVVEFKLPDNIATFEVRVYVVSGGNTHKFGHATSSVISRRDISMLPSVPRVVRPGDVFDCGVVVTRQDSTANINILAKTLSGTSSVKLREADLTSYEASKITPGSTAWRDSGVSVPWSGAEGSGPKEILFPFRAQGGIYPTKFMFSAQAPDQSNALVDAMETELQVKAAQSPVVVATSFAITASSAEATVWSEGLDLPRAMPGSGALVLTAGVGYLPSVVVFAGDVMDHKMNNGPNLVAALLPATALGYYYEAGTDIQFETRTAAKLDAAAKAFDFSIANLAAYTDNSYRKLGLMYKQGDTSAGWRRASVSLNSFAIIAARIIGRRSTRNIAGSPPAPSTSDWGTLQITVPTEQHMWVTALETELERQVAELRDTNKQNPCRKDCWQSWETLAQIRAALGFTFRFRMGAANEELGMTRLLEKGLGRNKLSARGLAYISLAYTLHGSTEATSLTAVHNALVNLVRVQGGTAYIASSISSRHSAGLTTNALVLLAIALIPAEVRNRYYAADSGSTLVARLALYVARGGRASGGYSVGAIESAYASVALAVYDHAMGSTKPELSLDASSGRTRLLDYDARGTGAPPKESATPWEDLPAAPPPVEFTVSGQGQVSVSASLNFVPASVPTQGAVYRGIYLEKVVQRMDPITGAAVGKPLQIIELGASVVVTIQLTTPDDLSRVVLEDLSAGGLEPVDPKVAGDNAGSSQDNGCSDNGWWSWWCLPSFPLRETYSDRVVWTSWDTLQAGTHTVSYQAVAVTRGIFTFPAAQAYEEEQPEVMGLSQGGSIVIMGLRSNVPIKVEDAPVIAPTPGQDFEFVFDMAAPDPGDRQAVDAVLLEFKVAPRVYVAPKDCGVCPDGASCELSTGECLCYTNKESGFAPCNNGTTSSDGSTSGAPETSTTGSTASAASRTSSTTTALVAAAISTTTAIAATSAPTLAPTEAPKTTKITMAIALDHKQVFDESKFKEELAKATGVNADEVELESIGYKVTVTYTFPTDISEDILKKSIADAHGVAIEDVTLTKHDPRRRLTDSASHVTAEIKCASAEQSGQVANTAANSSVVTEKLAENGVTAEATVKTAPQQQVEVKTKVVSQSEASTENLEQIGTKLGGAVTVTDVTKPLPTTTMAGCSNPTKDHGGTDSRTMFASSSPVAPATCQSETQTRTCNNGTFGSWSGTYAESTCNVQGARCSNPDTASGDTDSRTTYASSDVTAPAACQSETQTRTCNAGTFGSWSGTYTSLSCTVQTPTPAPTQAPASTNTSAPTPAPTPTPTLDSTGQNEEEMAANRAMASASGAPMIGYLVCFGSAVTLTMRKSPYFEL